MHRELRKLLDDAEGSSELVIAINVDIRGFSAFCTKVDSSETALFVKRVYMKLIDKYFPNPSFFKPTGDGLMVLFAYKEKELQNTARTVVASCLTVLDDFATLCTDDPVINFEVPRKIGIGLSRGSACRLISQEKTLDYSGRPLNLASRLMDLARPAGLVFDESFRIEILEEGQKKSFGMEKVYLKGIAETNPIGIYYTKGLTEISPLSKKPLQDIEWVKMSDTKKLSQIMQFARFAWDLETKPSDPSAIKLIIKMDKVVKGKKVPGVTLSIEFADFEYTLTAGVPRVIARFDKLAESLKAQGIKRSWEVKIEIAYPK